ncbi:DNA-binding protein WhiA [Alicyclobacillus vulcanalis]|uniref:Probable cell division protein WhiA n=1 Tax=Alicyclobacillus vulcanalis TaxID=252246 RepID=A0A1N7NWF2_9BACL|nr:DNA-binding protein WhiA [Alicyclobacillus vulcanalis]SIT02611.1 hypothetical protein SAMN05421799_11015 [Alicyclobacillus vulcanalis]
MSFAAETKKELTQIASDPAATRYELMAVFALSASFRLKEGAGALVMETENVATARRVYTSIKQLFGLRPEVVVRRKMRLKKNHVYTLRLSRAQAEQVLEQLEYRGEIAEGPLACAWSLPRRDEARRAFLRGAFLASGSVNAPGSSSYHLEMYAHSHDLADWLMHLMNHYGLNARVTARKKGYIVYIKEVEKIVEFLSVIGAVRALLQFEDRRIVKGMRNQVNRLVNCETANMNKTISAAVRQLEHIRLIEHTLGLESLPEHLREAAMLRLQYPESNLQELSAAIGGRVSKSGLNHRFRKLEEIAQALRDRSKKGGAAVDKSSEMSHKEP